MREMENRIVEYMNRSGLIWFLKASANTDIIKLVKKFGDGKQILIVLNYTDKQVLHIKEFEEVYIKHLEKFLTLVNSNNSTYFKNITCNWIELDGTYYNNAILLYSNKDVNIWEWFNKIKGVLKLSRPIPSLQKQEDKAEEIKKMSSNLEKLMALIKENRFSIRWLMVWYEINQARATSFFNYIRWLWLFEIDKKNPNIKHYNQEMLESDFITEEILDFLLNWEL